MPVWGHSGGSIYVTHFWGTCKQSGLCCSLLSLLVLFRAASIALAWSRELCWPVTDPASPSGFVSYFVTRLYCTACISVLNKLLFAPFSCFLLHGLGYAYQHVLSAVMLLSAVPGILLHSDFPGFLLLCLPLSPHGLSLCQASPWNPQGSSTPQTGCPCLSSLNMYQVFLASPWHHPAGVSSCRHGHVAWHSELSGWFLATCICGPPPGSRASLGNPWLPWLFSQDLECLL